MILIGRVVRITAFRLTGAEPFLRLATTSIIRSIHVIAVLFIHRQIMKRRTRFQSDTVIMVFRVTPARMKNPQQAKI